MVARFRYIALVVFFTLTISAPIAHASGTAIPNTTITLDVGSVGSVRQSGPISSISGPYTTNAGSNLILIAGVVIANDGTAPTVSSFTYGGTALTKIGSQLSASGDIDVEMWELPNPDVAPGLGTHTMTITFSGSASIGAFGASGTFFGVSGVRGFASAQALTVVIGTSKVGDLLIDTVGAATSTLTPSASQIPIGSISGTLSGVSAGASVIGASSGFSMSWTGGLTVGDPAILVVSLIPAAVTVVPEYPWGLPLLAILMLLSYGLLKRRVQTKQRR